MPRFLVGGDMNNELEFLDILTVLSFVMQVSNRINIADIQSIAMDIHNHLDEQDKKLNQIMEVLNAEH